MSFKNLVVALICSGAVFLIACSNKTVPVINYTGTPIETSSAKPDLNKIKKAIVLGGIKAGWQMQPVADGHILASLFSAGHIIKVDVKYDTKTYSITYKESSNLEYNGTTISPDYNNWVGKLNSNIRSQLSKI